MKKHEAKIEILLSNIVTISFPYCPLFLSNIVTISEWSNAQNAFSATFSLLLCDLLLGNLDRYKNISTRLKLGPFEEDGLIRTASTERQRQQSSDEPESPGSGKPCILLCSGLSTGIRD